jgi:3-oxoacyl-[acyl-carrier-protein] synthase-1
MGGQPLAILSTGLVCSVGLNAPAACAAIRAGVTNPSETRFIDSTGEWIMAHQVVLEKPWRGSTKLAKMAATAINECLVNIDRGKWSGIPLLLCVAERERPGRMDAVEDQLFTGIEEELGAHFSAYSSILPHGRVSTGVALKVARKLIYEQCAEAVLIAAADSLLTASALSALEQSDRILTNGNSNGFMPGEGAGAVLIGRPTGTPQVHCVGLGFGVEISAIDCDEPLRADGLTEAIKSALVDAQCELHDLDFRITDISGEHYYFKEAALALSRILRMRKHDFDILHPADCIGECGAVAGVAMLAVVDVACHKGYARGWNILAHMANDAGSRCACVFRFGIA